MQNYNIIIKLKRFSANYTLLSTACTNLVFTAVKTS